MKHHAINLVEFRSLSARLKLPLWQTVGVLETPWLFTIHNARDGSLEAFTAAEIAVWMGFEGDADGLAPTVVSLVVHDDTIEFQSANSEPNMWIWP